MIQMMQGHALTILSGMPRDSLFDAVITDPPYASGAATQNGISAKTSTKYTSSKRGNCPFPDFEGDAMDKRSWANLMLQVLLEARMRTKPGGVIAMFVDWRQTPIASDLMQWAGWTWRGMAQWDKGNCRPQKGRFRQQTENILWGSNGALPVDRPVPCLPGVFTCPNVSGKERRHQTQKPLELMRQIVRICVPGGCILDPFMGSGTTLLAADLEGYDAIGIELNEAIFRSAQERIKERT